MPTREDVSMFIPSENGEIQLPRETTGFTVDGNIIDTDSYNCYCMIEIRDGGRDPFFWVKVNTNGSPFDPWGSSGVRNSKEYLPEMGKNQWQFHRVSEDCFRNYLKFLTVRNHVYFRVAHRGISYT